MSDPVSINFNSDEFQKTLREYMAVSSRELSEALNNKLFYIAVGAARLTPKADREQIEHELGITGYKVVYNKAKQLFANTNKKTGALRIAASRKPKEGAIYVGERRSISLRKTKMRKSVNMVTRGGSKMIYAIINARMKRAKKKPIFGAEMGEAAAKLLTKRRRSVGTLKAGWTHAIRKIGTAIGITFNNEGASKTVKGTSTATLARPGFTPSCSLEYDVNSFTKDHQPYISSEVRAALTQSFMDEMKSMGEYILRKLQGRANTMSGRRMGPGEAEAFIKRMLAGK